MATNLIASHVKSCSYKVGTTPYHDIRRSYIYIYIYTSSYLSLSPVCHVGCTRSLMSYGDPAYQKRFCSSQVAQKVSTRSAQINNESLHAPHKIHLIRNQHAPILICKLSAHTPYPQDAKNHGPKGPWGRSILRAARSNF